MIVEFPTHHVRSRGHGNTALVHSLSVYLGYIGPSTAAGTR